MPRKKATVQFSQNINNIEEQYIRSGGKDPYVLTLLTRAHGDGKKARDETTAKDLTKNYETMKQALIRRYNDVELENVKLQYELLSIQQQLKSQLPDGPGTTPKTVSSPVAPTISPVKMQQNFRSNVVQPEGYLRLVQTKPDTLSQQPFSFPTGLPFLPGLQPNLRNPFGNTYIVTGDEVYINGLDVTTGERKSPISPTFQTRKSNGRQRSLSAVRAVRTPTMGFDADWDFEDPDVEYNAANFFEVNSSVPRGEYDFSSGVLIFFDFVTKLPKEARFCRLSVALITAGRMKPPISFTALPTEQYSPGDHPEFTHFTTVCRFAFCLAVSGGRPSGMSRKSGISLIAEVMISPDKPLDDQAPVLGWIRHGWAPIKATKKVFDDDSTLTTYAGRFRTMLRKALPLTRDEDGLLEFIPDSRQERIEHRTEMFYRIVNTHQAATERLAPVDIKYIGHYNEF